MADVVYILCSLASLACAVLLLRNYLRRRMPLVLWTGLCFAALAINNLLLVLDRVFLADVDLLVPRMLLSLLGVGGLLVSMIRTDLG